METKKVQIQGRGGQKTTVELKKGFVRCGVLEYEVWVSNLADIGKMQEHSDYISLGMVLTPADRKRIDGLPN